MSIQRCEECGAISEILLIHQDTCSRSTPTPSVGDRIRLIEMPHDPDPVPPGTEGTVTEVTEFDSPIPASYSEWEDLKPVHTQLPAPATTAQVAVKWDNGRHLFLLLPGDTFEIIQETT